jgi:hypothetical protein
MGVWSGFSMIWGLTGLPVVLGRVMRLICGRWGFEMGKSGRAAPDAHISESRYGAPGGWVPRLFLQSFLTVDFFGVIFWVLILRLLIRLLIR